MSKRKLSSNPMPEAVACTRAHRPGARVMTHENTHGN